MFNRGNRRLLRTCALGLAAIVVCLVAAFWVARRPSAQERRPLDVVRQGSSPKALPAETVHQIEAFCGDCHAVPRPESFDRNRWHAEILKGYEFYIASGRTDLAPPPVHQTLAYFRAGAPEEMTLSQSDEAAAPWSAPFQVEKFFLESGNGVLPEIAHLRWEALEREDRPVLLACDMRYGQVVELDLQSKGRGAPQLLARLNNPCRLEVCDLNGDGAKDLVVADLGSYSPADHDRGRVVLVKGQPETGTYSTVELASGLGRVADVRAADFDGDGDLDLLVAEFGWHRTGGILLLRNDSPRGGRLEFELERIDDRPGAIHLPVHDFNGDGQFDFAALISQEHESVDLFVNAGGGRFHRFPLWSAPDLTFGSSGMELVDLDRDGDQDILYTNGDAFDNTYIGPWHGVQWLENRGGEFAYHRLTDMPGAYRALTGDVDQDGDLDIVAAAWLPPKAIPREIAASLASLVCLEQTEPGVFVRHTLERGSPYSITLEMADFDRDGDPDFAIGSGPIVAKARRDTHYLAIWWNQTITSGQ